MLYPTELRARIGGSLQFADFRLVAAKTFSTYQEYASKAFLATRRNSTKLEQSSGDSFGVGSLNVREFPRKLYEMLIVYTLFLVRLSNFRLRVRGSQKQREAGFRGHHWGLSLQGRWKALAACDHEKRRRGC